MSSAGPRVRIAVGVAGVAMMAEAVYKYVSDDVDEYSRALLGTRFTFGASLLVGAITLPCAKKVYSIAGTVMRGGLGVDNVTVHLTGGQVAQMDTANGGAFHFDALPGGQAYTITVDALQYHDVAPASLDYNPLNASVNDADFTLTRQQFSIRGRVRNNDGGPLGNVALTLNGAPTATTSGVDGRYDLGNHPAGQGYIVSSQHTAVYTFDQPAQNPLTQNWHNAHLTGTRRRYTIRGQVTGANDTIRRVRVYLNREDIQGPAPYVETAADGRYEHQDVLAGYNYSIRAVKHGHYAAPGAQPIANHSADADNVDFAGHWNEFTVGGAVQDAHGAPLNGATVTLANNAGYQATQQSANGRYTFDSVPHGNGYRVSATLDHYTLQPRDIGQVAANMADADLTGTRNEWTIRGTVSYADGGTRRVTLNLTGGRWPRRGPPRPRRTAAIRSTTFPRATSTP